MQVKHQQSTCMYLPGQKCAAYVEFRYAWLLLNRPSHFRKKETRYTGYIRSRKWIKTKTFKHRRFATANRQHAIPTWSFLGKKRKITKGRTGSQETTEEEGKGEQNGRKRETRKKENLERKEREEIKKKGRESEKKRKKEEEKRRNLRMKFCWINSFRPLNSCGNCKNFAMHISGKQ